MIDKITFIPFDKIFPQTKGSKIQTRQEAIRLARKVATALKKESEKLAREEKEQQNSTSARFFCPTS